MGIPDSGPSAGVPETCHEFKNESTRKVNGQLRLQRPLQMPAKHLYFIGTAGSGKSTLTNAFSQWLDNEGYDSILVNLDPGADTLFYECDVDVRDWIKLDDIMREHGLGPNGAQVVAADMLALNIRELAQVVAGYDTEYVLFDTPGQTELFTFRQSSWAVIDGLSGEAACLAYLFDPALTKTANGFVAGLMLAATAHFRLPIPMMSILSKADTLTDSDLDRIALWGKDYYALFNALLDDPASPQTQMSIEFLQALESLGANPNLIPVSADTGEGLEDIYAEVQQFFEGGEDIERGARD